VLPDLSAGAGQQGGRIGARDEDIRGSELGSRSGPGKAGKWAARVDGVATADSVAQDRPIAFTTGSALSCSLRGDRRKRPALPGVAGDDENGAAAARGAAQIPCALVLA